MRTGVLLAGPYITFLIFKMGLLRSFRGEERINTPALLVLVTLRLVGIVRRIGLGAYVLVEPSSEDDDESMVTEAAQVASADPKSSST